MHKFFTMKDKIFVAGSTGFLGKRLVKRLAKEKMNFIGTSLSLGVDFRDMKKLDKFIKKERPTIIMNCAAYIGGIKFGLDHEGEIYFNNTLINTNLFECARKHKIKRIINPISNCSYPNVLEKNFKEDEWWDGPLHYSVMVYGFTKKATWVQSYAYNKQYNLDTVNFLVPNMYGPEDHFDEVRSHALGALIKKIIKAQLEKTPEVIIWGSGNPVREWLYIDDCVEAFIRGLSIDPIVEPINLGQGTGITIKDMAKIIQKIVGYKGKLVYDRSRPDGAPYKIMNVDRMKKIFNWTPPTRLEAGIKKTIDWYYKYRIRK